VRQPLRPSNQGRTSRTLTIPAPSKGWNVRDALDSMNPLFAVTMENMWPVSGGVTLRNGSTPHATGLGGEVFFLAEFDAGSTNTMIAGANGNLWDVTSSGAASSLKSGLISDKWQFAQFDDAAGGARMGLVNGSDAPQIYNGSTVSAMTISGTGLTPANLNGINVFKGRSYFWDSNTQDFWYSATNALGGTLTKFPLGRVSGFGGNLIAMGTWTVDAGDGVNDVAVFCMSSGDVIVYNGDDPGATWALVGIYHIGGIMSVRGLAKVGSDLVVLTSDGYIPMSQVLRAGNIAASKVSDNIRNEILSVTSAYKSNYGWDILQYPKANMLLFNVPVSATQFDQHVMNTLTGAWTKFTAWNGRSWSLLNDDLYFGENGTVFKADTGTSDNGNFIIGIGQQAWNRLGLSGIQKTVTLGTFFGKTDSNDVSYKLDMGVDFIDPTGDPDENLPLVFDNRITHSGDARVTSDGSFRTSIPDATVIKRWESVLLQGESFSPRIQIKSTSANFDWYSTGLVFQTGGLI